MRVVGLILACCLFFAFSAFGQNNTEQNKDTKPKRFTIYGTVGVIGLGSINGEVLVIKSRHTGIWFNAGIGSISNFGGSAKYVSSAFKVVSGKKQNKFELAGGAIYLYQDANNAENQVLPAASLGYRFQQEKGPFVFRVGLGFPEIVYISLGLSF